MRPRAAGLAVLLFICFAALFCTGAAAETGSVLSIADAPETVRRGSAFRIELAPAHQDLSAFVLFAEYDSADIERAEAEFSGTFDADYTYVSAQEGGSPSSTRPKTGAPRRRTGASSSPLRRKAMRSPTRCLSASPSPTPPPATHSPCWVRRRRSTPSPPSSRRPPRTARCFRCCRPRASSPPLSTRTSLTTRSRSRIRALRSSLTPYPPRARAYASTGRTSARPAAPSSLNSRSPPRTARRSPSTRSPRRGSKKRKAPIPKSIRPAR